MKIISFLLTLFFFIQIFNSNAQIKVYDDNRVKVFGDKPGDDPNADLSMQVYGSYGEYLANGRIGFGAYNESGYLPFIGEMVYVSELGENVDSDKLELCGSNGVYLTMSQGYGLGNIIGKLDREFDVIFGVLTDVSSFMFETDVYAKGILLSSDSRFKENIKPLGKKLSFLKQLNGVSYNLKRSKKQPIDISSMENLTEKERKDLELINKMNYEDHTRLGFIAQEVKALFPELVQEDLDGYLYIDYVGMIPVLVESVKEQQEQIDELLKLAKKKGLLTNEN